MKLRDLIGILMTKNYEGIEIYDELKGEADGNKSV